MVSSITTSSVIDMGGTSSTLTINEAWANANFSGTLSIHNYSADAFETGGAGQLLFSGSGDFGSDVNLNIKFSLGN